MTFELLHNLFSPQKVANFVGRNTLLSSNLIQFLGAAHSCGGGVQTFDQQIFFDDDTFSNKSGEEFVHLVYSSNC